MKQFRRVVLLALLLASSIGITHSVGAFVLSDPGRVWRVVPVNFAIDQNSVGTASGGPGLSIAVSALSASVASWNDTGSGWSGVVASNVTSHAASNGTNEVFWVRTWDPALGDVNSVLAVASTSLTGIGPQFTSIETDIIFNGDRYDWAGGNPTARIPPNIATTHTTDVMAHEVGHSLGLGHSGSTTAIMYFRARNVGGVLNTDDQQGALTLYPPGAPLCTEDGQCPITPGTASRCGVGGICESVPPGELGALCNTGALLCGAGLTCIGVGGQPTACTKPCNSQADCGQSTFCVVTGGGNLCVPPGPNPVGGACTFRTDCQSGQCSASICRSACTGDDCECPIGERCATVQSGSLTLNFCFGGTSTCIRCGDGVIGGDETCDEGEANSDAIPDACRTTCVGADCGDGLVDTGEECDDSNLQSNDGCSAICALEPNAIDAGVNEEDGGTSALDSGLPDDVDSGFGGGQDAGVGPDDGMDGGCSCQIGGAGQPASHAWWGVIFFALWVHTRRRSVKS